MKLLAALIVAAVMVTSVTCAEPASKMTSMRPEAGSRASLAPGSRFEDEAAKFRAAGMKPSMIEKLTRRGISFERADSLREEGRLSWYWVTWYFTSYKEDPAGEWRKRQGLRDRLVSNGELPLNLATRLVTYWKDADSEWRKRKKLRQKLLKDKTLNRRNATFLVLRYADPIAAWKTKKGIRNELHKKEGLPLNQATEIVLKWKDAEKEWHEVRKLVRDEIFKAGGISHSDATEVVLRWGDPKKEWETRKTIRDKLITEGGLSRTRANSIVLRWGSDIEKEWKSRREIRDKLVEKFDIPEYFATTLVLNWEDPKSAIKDMRRDAKEIVRRTEISEARAMRLVLGATEPLKKLDDLEESLKGWGLSITEYAAIFPDLRYDTARIYAIWKVRADSGETVNPEGLKALGAFKRSAGRGIGEAIVEFRQPGEALFIGNSVMAYWVPGPPNLRSHVATLLVDCGESLSLIRQDRFGRQQSFGRHGFGVRIPEGRITKPEFKFRKDPHKFEPHGQQVPLREGDKLLVGENIALHLQGLTEKGLSIKLTAPAGAEVAQGRQKLNRVVIKDAPISWGSARWVGLEEAKRLLIKQFLDAKGCNDKDAHEEIAFEAKSNEDGFFTFCLGKDAMEKPFNVSLWTGIRGPGIAKIRRYYDEDLEGFVFEARRLSGERPVAATSIIRYNEERKMSGLAACDKVRELLKRQLLGLQDVSAETGYKEMGPFEVVVPEGGKYRVTISSEEGVPASLATGSPKSGKALLAIGYDLNRKCRVFKTERVVDGKLIAATSIRQRVLRKGVNAFVQIENKVVDFGEAKLKQRFNPHEGPRIAKAGAEYAQRVYDEVDRLVDIDTAGLARTTFYIELFKAQKETGQLSEREKMALANKVIRHFVGEALGKEFLEEFKDTDDTPVQVKAIKASGAIELRAALARAA